MVNQFAKFAADLAERSAPIWDLLHKDRAWVWEAVHQKSFDAVKQAIITAPVLALYDAAKPSGCQADNRLSRQFFLWAWFCFTSAAARQVMATSHLCVTVT
jgi:hypothetical protein